jgi:fatty acid synthase subunit alpha
VLQRAVDSLSRREQAYRSSPPQDMGFAIQGIIALASTASTGKFAAGTRQGHSHQRNRESFKVPHATTRHSISSPSNVHSKEIRTSTELKFDLISQSFLRPSSTRATAQPKFSEHLQYRKAYIRREAQRLTKSALSVSGNKFWKSDTSIAPIRGAIAVWGLGIDDIDSVSLHGTSTKSTRLTRPKYFNISYRT